MNEKYPYGKGAPRPGRQNFKRPVYKVDLPGPADNDRLKKKGRRGNPFTGIGHAALVFLALTLTGCAGFKSVAAARAAQVERCECRQLANGHYVIWDGGRK